MSQPDEFDIIDLWEVSRELKRAEENLERLGKDLFGDIFLWCEADEDKKIFLVGLESGHDTDEDILVYNEKCQYVGPMIGDEVVESRNR